MSTPEQNDQEMAITVWEDGTWQVWGVLDAYYAQNDPSWLVTIPLKELPKRHLNPAEHCDGCVSRASASPYSVRAA